MRVLVVSQYFYPENFRINDVVEGLVERGHEVDVLCGIPNYPDGHFFTGYSFLGPYREKYKGASLIRVPIVPRGKGKSLQLILNYLSFVISGCLLGPFLLRKKYDVIFVNQLSPVTIALPAILIKKIQKIPMFLWVADLWPDSLVATNTVRSKKVLKLVTKLVRYIYKHSDTILVTSKGFIDRIKAIGISENKIEYWPQWGEKLFSKKDDFKISDINLPESEFKICFAGNIGTSQSFETIVDAAEILKNYPEIHWIILGDGNMKEWVASEILTRGLTKSFHLLGSYPIDRMPDFFSLMDGLLFSLKKTPLFEITVPGKVQAYLASGKPIIASIDGEGAAVIRESGAGLTSSAGDSKELASKVLELYQMGPRKRDAMGRSGKEYFQEHFEREKLLFKLEAFMQ